MLSAETLPLRLRLAVEVAEGVDHADGAGADDDDEQGWEDAQEHGEEDFDGDFLGLFLGSLAADQSHLDGLFAEDAADGQAEAVGPRRRTSWRLAPML